MSNGHLNHQAREEIQTASGRVSELARKFNVSRATVRRWRERESARNKPRQHGNPARVLTPGEKLSLLELRRICGLSLSQLHAAGGYLLNKRFSRATLHRLLERHGLETLEHKGSLLSEERLPEGYKQYVLPFRVKCPAAGVEKFVSFVYSPSLPDQIAWKVSDREDDVYWKESIIVQPRIHCQWWLKVEAGRQFYVRKSKTPPRVDLLNIETILRSKELEEGLIKGHISDNIQSIEDYLTELSYRLSVEESPLPKGIPSKLVPLKDSDLTSGENPIRRHAS